MSLSLKSSRDYPLFKWSLQWPYNYELNAMLTKKNYCTLKLYNKEADLCSVSGRMSLRKEAETGACWMRGDTQACGRGKGLQTQPADCVGTCSRRELEGSECGGRHHTGASHQHGWALDIYPSLGLPIDLNFSPFVGAAQRQYGPSR